MRRCFGDSRSRPHSLKDGYQLFLKPAVMLLLVVPCAVSPIMPETMTLSRSFCSAPTRRSHLSSPVDRVWPAVRLVPVLPIESLADCTVSKLRLVWPAAPGRGTTPCWVML